MFEKATVQLFGVPEVGSGRLAVIMTNEPFATKPPPTAISPALQAAVTEPELPPATEALVAVRT